MLILIEGSSKGYLVSNLIFRMIYPRIRIIRKYFALKILIHILNKRHIFCISFRSVWLQFPPFDNWLSIWITKRSFHRNLIISQLNCRKNF